MKKLLFLGLAALITLSAPATYADQRTDYVKRLETCRAILQEFQDNPAYAIPKPVLERAHGIVIINQFKAGFIFGVTGGYGAILVKRQDGSWSIPVLLDAGGASIGLQVGGDAIETIYVLTDDETPRRLFSGRFNVGVDAKAAIGPKWTEMESVNKDILATPVLIYTKSKGLYAGAVVKAGFITRNDDANRILYKTPYTMPELLYGNFVEASDDVTALKREVAALTAAK